MGKTINRVAVLGAGTMGARIAAHLANAGVPCWLLDVVPSDAGSDREKRNRIASAGLEAARKAKPAAFFEPGLARLVAIGNFEDDLKLVASADWIIEAVVENLELKRELLRKVEAVRKPGTIITTNTSGLPVAKIAEGFLTISGGTGLARIFSIRHATCGCWKSFPRQILIALPWRPSLT